MIPDSRGGLGGTPSPTPAPRRDSALPERLSGVGIMRPLGPCVEAAAASRRSSSPPAPRRIRRQARRAVQPGLGTPAVRGARARTDRAASLPGRPGPRAPRRPATPLARVVRPRRPGGAASGSVSAGSVPGRAAPRRLPAGCGTASARGVPWSSTAVHHLAMLIEPEGVAAALGAAVRQSIRGGGAAPTAFSARQRRSR